MGVTFLESGGFSKIMAAAERFERKRKKKKRITIIILQFVWAGSLCTDTF